MFTSGKAGIACTILISTLSSVVALAAETPTYTSAPLKKKFRTGLVQSASHQAFIKKAKRASFPVSAGTIQGKFSMRGMAGTVEDQGDCGSCWDFSLTAALRGSYMMIGKDPGRLSYNYLLNCATEQWGCNGGNFDAADWFLNPKGAPAYGSDGPYRAASGRCKKRSAVAGTADYRILGVKGSEASFRDMAYVLSVLKRPITVDVAADDLWQGYTGGVYNGCSWQGPSVYTNHMVIIEGYDCEKSVDANGKCVFDASGNLPPGVGTWVVRNSWGKGWGENGYMTTKATDQRGLRCNEIAAETLYFEL